MMFDAGIPVDDLPEYSSAVQPQDKYVVRLPDGLRDRIKAQAKREGRSMNMEIVRVLEWAFPEAHQAGTPLAKRDLPLTEAISELRSIVRQKIDRGSTRR